VWGESNVNNLFTITKKSAGAQRSAGWTGWALFNNKLNKRRLIMMDAQGAKVAQEPISNEVMKLTQQVSEEARQIAERLNNKLTPVMRSSTPIDTGRCEKTLMPQREFPPLFSEWNSYVLSIQSSLKTIEEAIRRTEL
jgi:hypothetical protein